MSTACNAISLSRTNLLTWRSSTISECPWHMKGIDNIRMPVAHEGHWQYQNAHPHLKGIDNIRMPVLYKHKPADSLTSMNQPTAWQAQTCRQLDKYKSASSLQYYKLASQKPANSLQHYMLDKHNPAHSLTSTKLLTAYFYTCLSLSTSMNHPTACIGMIVSCQAMAWIH